MPVALSLLRGNMKSGFKDPTAIKNQKPQDEPQDGKKSPWDFRCPQYDQRTGSFINAGTHYGVGRKVPVGRVGNPKMTVPTLPHGKVDTMENDKKG